MYSFEEQRSVAVAESSQPVRIDASLLSRYIEALGAIGWQPQGGIVRPVYSPAWVQAREQLAEWMRAAGLEVYGDAVGNLFGRLRGSEESGTILTGSHFDTVPLGGQIRWRSGCPGGTGGAADAARAGRATAAPPGGGGAVRRGGESFPGQLLGHARRAGADRGGRTGAPAR